LATAEHQAQPPQPAVEAAIAPAAPHAAREAAAAPAADAHKPAAAPTGAAHTPAKPPAAELAITTVRPVPAYAQKGVLALPRSTLGLSDEAKAAARQAVADARAAAPPGPARKPGARVAETPLAQASESAAAAEGAPAKPAAAAAVPTGPVFAVSTRALRTRAEAEQVQAAMGALLRTTGAIGIKLELLPEGEDWRVVAWPFTNQADADRARAMLVGRGMRVQVLRF
jgi:hypothetical protein